MSNLKISQKVEVVNLAEIYEPWCKLLCMLDIKGYDCADLIDLEKQQGVIIAKTFNESDNDIIHVCKTSDKKIFFASEKALKPHIEKHQRTIDELFDFWNENGKPMVKISDNYYSIQNFDFSEGRIRTRLDYHTASNFQKNLRRFCPVKRQNSPF